MTPDSDLLQLAASLTFVRDNQMTAAVTVQEQGLIFSFKPNLRETMGLNVG
jgi:hypothetical protein